MVTNESLEMIDELAGEILKIISKAIEMMPESVIKKALEDKIVQGLMKTAGGLAQIATGCELCTTVVGTIQGIPMIVFGTNMAIEGISELWYISKGEFDQEGKNLIKEATGHKADNIVELAELGVAIWSGRVASKRAASKAAGRIAGEAEKVSEGLQKLRGFRKAKFKTKKLVRKFLPKKRYRKMAVVDVEELARKQGLKPNLQLFAEELEENILATSKHILKNVDLPVAGKIRYIPPETWTPSQPLPRVNGGYIDKFGNVWMKGPTRTIGEPFEWDVQLSKTGKNKLGWLSRDSSHLNVSLKGEITHK